MFLFLPLVLCGYWAVGSKRKNLFLLFASLLFYAWGEGRDILVLLFLIFINYFLGIFAARYRGATNARVIIWLTLGINIGVLILYKYVSFFVITLNVVLKHTPLSLPPFQSSHLPLGISFITFQAIAYVIDVCREETEPQRDLPRFALFMALFPKIIAGPIIRYTEVSGDLADRKPRMELVASGVKRFIVGFGKKVLIADTLATTADAIFSIPTPELTASIAWIGIVSYTLQLYFDFSGYSDMAIGLGRIFGFKFQENFNYPYISRSLTEFWRRWHISLSTWFRDYLFLPLSYVLMTEGIRRKVAQGKYKKNYRAVFSIVTVFTLCGLWHGAGWNYVIWGMLHGIVLGVESLWLSKAMKKWWSPLQRAYLLFVIMSTWVFFRIQDLNDVYGYFKSLAGLSNGLGLDFTAYSYVNGPFVLAVVAGIVASMPVSQSILEYLQRGKFHRFVPIVEISCLVIIMVASFAALTGSTFKPFLYQQF